MIHAEPALRLEMAALGYFFDAAAAAWAAVNEIRVAAAYPDEAHAVCAEYREAQLSELEAVLLNALKRGEQWLSFNSAESGAPPLTTRRSHRNVKL